MTKPLKAELSSKHRMQDPGRVREAEEDLRPIGCGQYRIDDEPELPQGYHHVRSAIGVLLECADVKLG